MKQFLLLIALSTLLLACSKKEENAEPKDQALENVSVANFAPKFVLKNTEDQFYKLDDFKGKIVLIDIWATWCGPCIRQIPALKKLNEQFKGTDFQLLGVSVDKEADHEKWRNFVARNALAGIQLYAGKATPFAADYNATSIPKFVLIDRKGEIITEDLPQPYVRGSEDVNADLVKIIEAELAKG